MPNPLYWNEKVLLAKIESAYATDPTLTGAANAILATEVSIRPMDGDDVSRNLDLPYLGAQETFPSGLAVVLTFSTELAGSGTAGAAPGWGPLMRGCGFAETISAGVSVTYSKVSTSFESLYMKLWINNTLHALKGCRGTGKLALNAQGIPVIQWTVTGLFVDPTEVSQATPTLSGFKVPLIATAANTPTFTLNSVAMVLRSYTLDFGCQVQKRLLVGKEQIIITNHLEKLDIQVEAVPLSTLDIYALAKARTKVPVSIVHGTAAGNISTISLPTSQLQRPTGYQQNQNIAEWPLSMTPLPTAAGNDQMSIVLT